GTGYSLHGGLRAKDGKGWEHQLRAYGKLLPQALERFSRQEWAVERSPSKGCCKVRAEGDARNAMGGTAASLPLLHAGDHGGIRSARPPGSAPRVRMMAPLQRPIAKISRRQLSGASASSAFQSAVNEL